MLQVFNVSKAFPSLSRVIDDVSLSVARGEIVGLVGPSGCGKSTLLRIISGLQPPDSGSITWEGKSLLERRPRERGVAMVFQEDGLFPDLTVRDNVAYGIADRNAEAVEVALTRMNLSALGDRLPHELSGGQRRRVAVARALAVRPQILLLDEPMAGLDDSLRELLGREIRGVTRRHDASTIFVTHDQSEALSMCDQVAVMIGGKIVDFGPPRLVFDHPESVQVAAFLGRSNFLDVDVLAVDSDRATVRLLGRDVEVPCHLAVSVDVSSTLLVRPNSVALRRLPDTREEAFQDRGVVLEVRYLGHSLDIVVETEDGTIVARVDSWTDEFEEGDVVQVIINLDRVWLLPR